MRSACRLAVAALAASPSFALAAPVVAPHSGDLLDGADAPDGNTANGVSLSCGFDTTRNGSKGWGLLAVVTSDAATFWSGTTSSQSLVNTTKGTASPSAAAARAAA